MIGYADSVEKDLPLTLATAVLLAVHPSNLLAACAAKLRIPMAPRVLFMQILLCTRRE